MSRTTVRGGPSGGYVSLTGTGEGSSPGDLLQSGGFFVEDTEGHEIQFSSIVAIALEAPTILIQNAGGAGESASLVGRVNLGGTSGGSIRFFDGVYAPQQTVSGSLSAVTDPNAQAVLTSLIDIFALCGFLVNGTT